MIERLSLLSDGSSATVRQLLTEASEDVLFLVDPRYTLDLQRLTLARMAEVLRTRNAGLVYADSADRARIDYQAGSVRDDFDFGPLLAISVARAREALAAYADIDSELRWGAMYDLRLKLSIRSSIVRVPEPLYTASDPDSRSAEDRLFDYLDPSKTEYEDEMESIATRHLKRIGAYLSPRPSRIFSDESKSEIRASVVIPVRDREATIGDAIASALSQRPPFEFNVIVVDNHSTDGTARVIDSHRAPRLVRRVPARMDLGIGGCWNEALYAPECGRFAVQLDSDDLFLNSDVLGCIIRAMETNGYVMLAGSYTTVDMNLDEVPPGVVAHKEWSRENGHNNLLRVNGVGAPRAYDVSFIREFGFPNVSYGEDYAMGLRVSRDFEIGRIYDPVYLCRRWAGNTDSNVSAELSNARNSYKDWLRTCEIEARIRLNAQDRT